MQLSVRGTFRNGVAQPSQVIKGRDGQQVIITFVEEAPKPPIQPDDDGNIEKDEWEELIDRCSVDTGITDWAHQHDHYLYGTAKKEDRHP